MTKHSLKRYAQGPDTIDWNDQPYPFRRFDGCSVYKLPEPGRELDVTWADLEHRQGVEPAEINLQNIGLLLELSFGLSAWKQYGPDRWTLRCNPSSGNLHPSEAYIINGLTDLMPQGVYHYVSYDHYLEQRCIFKNSELENTLFIGLSSIHWRESWKYGERAYRYCQLDAGHALAALSFAGAVLGWEIEFLNSYSDAEIACLLGIDCKAEFIKHETETPDWLCRIRCNNMGVVSVWEQEDLLETVQQSEWKGKARSLAAFHMYHWPVIDKVSQSAKNTLGVSTNWRSEELTGISSDCQIPATQLIRQRRSAQHFNSQSSAISLDSFMRMLSATLPVKSAPFCSWNWPPAVHFCLFVHKVEGLSPGLYCFPRSDQGLECFRNTTSPNFSWLEKRTDPGLYLMFQGDVRQVAKTLSCHQSIASDSIFSLAMLVEFSDCIGEHPWHYRRLFWECGLLGQILYLEAEAAGLRGTGIGCFFDDEVHDVLGIEDDKLQSLYHFTVGEPLEDTRIQTLPAYAHLTDS